MQLEHWALKWGVSTAALVDLRASLVLSTAETSVSMSEAGVASRVRLEAARAGVVLWRNNVGAAYTKTGALVRYGLCNDSSKLNAEFKSSDLVGIRPLLVEPRHVGLTVGQFVARETKRTGWVYNPRTRDKPQLNWIELVKSLGGDACFASGEGTF